MTFEILAILSLVLAAIPAVMFVWNLLQLRRLKRAQAQHGAVSVLIPARNETTNILGALQSVLQNQGVEFEVIVLDDHSEDDTAAIVREIAASDPRVRLETAPPLPAGWCGKMHACQILSQHARHALLVFMDADVRLAPDALVRLSARMNRDEHGTAPALVSGVPRQITGTFLEHLLIPLIHFVLLGFLPIWRMRRCTKPAYGAGCGQLLIAQAEAYHAVGGHAAIRESLHDGLNLPRAFRRAGFRTDIFDATDISSCRMYYNAREVLDGLTKNAHEGLAAPAQIGPWTLLLFGGQVVPWILLVCSIGLNPDVLRLALAAAALTLIPRILAAWRFHQSWLSVLLHPLSIAIFLVIQWRALLQSCFNRPKVWKGRSYAAQSKSLPPVSKPARVSTPVP
ncbi:MAG: hypothetical protein RLY20_158 [Verrucomicrobiota bacterium]